jgi:hypothetical protein
MTGADRFPAAFGLDLSASPPVCCRVAARGAARAVPWPPPEDVRRELESGTAALAVAAPAACTVVRRLEAPFASVRKAERIWPSLLDMDLPFPVEAAQCDYAPAEPEDGKVSTLACAIRRTDLDSLLQTAAGLGASPAFCDAEAPALWDRHLLEAPPKDDSRPVLLVHAAADHVTVLCGHGRRLERVHVLRSAPEKLPPEAWLARVRRLLPAPESGSGTGTPAATVWWSGGGNGPEGASVLDRLRRPLEDALPFRHATHREPGLFLARALASRAVGGRCAAFLSGDYLQPALARRRNRRIRGLAWAAMALSVLVLALNVAVRARFRAERDALQRELAATAAALVDGPLVPGQEVLMAERALADAEPGWEAVRAARAPAPRAAQAIALLRELAGRGIRFTRVAWTPAGLDIAGTAPAPKSVQALPGWTPDVSVQPAASGDPGRVAFRIKGAWPGEP